MKILKSLKNILLIFILASFIVMLSTSHSSAALQANPNTYYTKQLWATQWMQQIRAMEAANQAMGLNESYNSDYTSITSNNIDVHMMRSTEYGAIAILSASAYGNPSNAVNITTTTGNNTGVILKYSDSSFEFVAGGLQDYHIFSGVNNRYYDLYTTSQNSARRGDALGTATTTNPGAAGWHSAERANWLLAGELYSYFVRGGYGIFAYINEGYRDNRYSRGVAVCGQGM